MGPNNQPPFERPEQCNIVHERGMYRVIEGLQFTEASQEDPDPIDDLDLYIEEGVCQQDLNLTSGELQVGYAEFDTVDHHNGFYYAALVYRYYAAWKRVEDMMKWVPELGDEVRTYALTKTLYKACKKSPYDIDSKIESKMRDS